ncbi:AraC family transcriptional regulator [uncultured Spongiibacter sp.]|uniref:AraC family transcriptional regulator n=1 Tax=uncultured Spongiibacter sp. TaxID=870896 RepID=UPI00258C295E|nr:AraC family transcriptional regulator [uncultured Spongiibacter sp.]
MPYPDPNWSVYTTLANAVVRAGRCLGAPVDSLLIKADIDKKILANPDHRLPVEKVLQLYELVAHYSDTPDIGLYTGRISYLDGLNLQLYMSTICRTFREYLNLMPSVLRFTGDIGEVRIRGEKAHIRLEWYPLWTETTKQRYLSDEMLTLSAMIVNSLCVLPIPVRRAKFTYRRPAKTELLVNAFGENLSFAEPVSCLYFDRESLDYPLARVSGGVTATLGRPVEHLFGDGRGRDEFLEQLRETIVRLLPEGELSIDHVASHLNVSKRTLQRRLSERDTQFQTLLQKVRGELAIRYLSDGRLTVTEIAFLLGYRDQGSFSSAFKQWHGISPREYRRR